MITILSQTRNAAVAAFLVTSASMFSQTVIFEQDGKNVPNDWKAINNVSTQPISQTGGNGYWLLETKSATEKDELTSSMYNLSSYATATITLEVATYGNGDNNSAKVEISKDGGTTWSESVLSKTPTSSKYIDGGTFNISNPGNFVVRLTNNGDKGKGVRIQNFKITATGQGTTTPAAPVLTAPAAPQQGTVGQEFSYELDASDDAVSFQVVAGSSLPAGLSLNAESGEISGTPTAAGTFTTKFVAANAGGQKSNTIDVTFIIKEEDTTTPPENPMPVGGTIFKQGELFFVGFDGKYETKGPADRFLIATLVDIAPGTHFGIANSRYEAGAAANVRTDRWGGPGDKPHTEPGLITFKYTGDTPIKKGTVMVFDLNGTSNGFNKIHFVSPQQTVSTESRNFSFEVVKSNKPNISNDDPDQMYLIQGGFELDQKTPTTGAARYILRGKLLHGFTNGNDWVPLTQANSGADTTNGNKTEKKKRSSRLPAALECLNFALPNGQGAAYYKNSETHEGSFRNILSSVNTPSKWTIGKPTIKPTVANADAKAFTENGTVQPGTWLGSNGTNWFYCENWENYQVPDKTTDVIIPATAVNKPVVKADDANAAKYKNTATFNNITIQEGAKLTMNGTTEIEMHGNWNNEGTFEMGNSTITFAGTGTQVINGNDTAKAETFYNVNLANNFNTQESNNLIAKGKLSVQPGYKVTAADGRYISAGNFENQGDGSNFIVEKDGSFVIDNAAASVSGQITVQRETKNSDGEQYNFLSAPVKGLNIKASTGSPRVQAYEEATDFFQDSEGEYIVGKGYAVKDAAAENLYNFQGEVVHGNQTYAMEKSGEGYNLLGNPYAAKFSLENFFVVNNNLDTTFYLWDSAVNKEVQQYGGAYNGNSYATYNVDNSTGARATGGVAQSNAQAETANDKVPNGILKVGQGFIAKATTAGNATFTNEMMVKEGGVAFFGNTAKKQDKDRYWLSLDTPTGVNNQIAVVYYGGGSNAFGKDDSEDISNASDLLYTVADGKKLIIHGRAPFSAEDLVKLGANAFADGTYKIKVDRAEGIFAGAQGIYLRDKATGAVVNLSEKPYSFRAEAGSLADRFEIAYTDARFLAAAEAAVADQVSVYEDNGGFVVAAPEKISEIRVYDAAGKLVQVSRPAERKAAVSASAWAKGVYHFVISAGQTTATKKVLKK
ncbi:Por secretion system C-terminal sorting domain-containing protein [Cruoricaptor ignavus]|uniref:Por secretion system C-terminal sorting domain-containing protein n=1 Tax=Cruoricaptor ignavus TaxID=1118202 RepID=A0A1M6F4Y5_9FLAO|nr:putative Ig domain-containing protein [Cruoricaptor ignavus]SHI92804.1 Por secretion system C-terminal sorting domain-containing protein [Cruoricaptor ignavus]